MRTLSISVVLALTATAHAGRSHFGWLGATDVLAEQDVELEVRVTEHDDLGATHIRETTLWTGIQVGLTDRLEATLPAEISDLSAVGIEPDFALRRYGAELSYRFVDRTRGLVPLARVAVLLDVVRNGVTRGELDGILAYRRGRLIAAGETGVTVDASRGGLRVVVRSTLGASFELRGGLHLGGELHGEYDRDASDASWLAAGPSVSWTRGRFWFAATYAIGLSNIASAPRLAWGAAF
jgi:hypothetical protein